MKYIVAALKILKSLSNYRFSALVIIILLAQFTKILEVVKTFNS